VSQKASARHIDTGGDDPAHRLMICDSAQTQSVGRSTKNTTLYFPHDWQADESCRWTCRARWMTVSTVSAAVIDSEQRLAMQSRHVGRSAMRAVTRVVLARRSLERGLTGCLSTRAAVSLRERHWGAIADPVRRGKDAMCRLGAILVTLALVVGAATTAAASCRWEWDCSAGYPCKQVQQCDNALNSPAIKPPSAVEMPAIKPPAVSPVPVGPSVRPLQGPTIPPVGTTKCQEQQMCDSSGRCRWETTCR
jgi:hypothetical protein